MRSPFLSNFKNSPASDGISYPPSGDGGAIILEKAGKRFNREWIFRNITYTFQQGKSYAITGPNGSGKSTLLQTIAGAIAHSEGSIEYVLRNWESGIGNWGKAGNNEQGIRSNEQGIENQQLETENIYKQISIVAPYLEVIEEMTATEFLQFHASFKQLIPTITIPQILEIIGLQTATDKQIRFYSSGMKQRIKLAQAVFSNVPVLLLDEPCTNLDTAGYVLYHQLIKDYCADKLIIVSSNDLNEYDFCTEKLNILDWK